MSSRSPSDFASFHEIRIAAAFPLDQGSLKELRMVYELIKPATQDLRRQHALHNGEHLLEMMVPRCGS
ncbi:hypothetical protein CPC08DRAFT_371779 [Agrocybe pediades]|nr:hypothetical protein CPC08DRAFT_371779 [Agrocybe pediades]